MICEFVRRGDRAQQIALCQRHIHLPKLIYGELRVKAIERLVEADA